MLRLELQGAFGNRYFRIAVLAGLILVLLGLGNYTHPYDIFLIRKFDPYHHPSLVNVFDATIWAMGPPFSVLAPVLAVLPYATSFVQDFDADYLEQLFLYSNLKAYFRSKFVANFLVGGVTLVIPIVFAYLFGLIFYYRDLPVSPNIRIGSGPGGPFSGLYQAAPHLYIFTTFGWVFLFGAVYASLGLGISALIRNRYVVLVAPLALYFLVQYVFEVLDKQYSAKGMFHRWGAFASNDPLMTPLATGFTVYMHLGVIFLLSMLLMVVFARQRRVIPKHRSTIHRLMESIIQQVRSA